MTKEPKKRGRRANTTPPTPQQMEYAVHRSMFPDRPAREAAEVAGYSPGTPTTHIDNSAGVKRAMQTVEKQRELMQQKPGFSFTDVAERVKKRAENEMVPPGVQTDNDKVLNKMMGYDAPTVIHQKSMGLMLEFNNLSGADLAALEEVLLPKSDEVGEE